MFFITIGAILVYLLLQWLNKKKTEYHSHEYWENRYDWYEQEMDWYQGFDKLNTDFNIETILKAKYPNKKKCKILELGCGNSSLAYDLYQTGYTNISSIDFSNIIIQRMKKKYADTSIRFMAVDFTKMNEVFSKEEFDVIIEKAGLDSIATKETPDVPFLLQSVYDKMYYVLKPNGLVLSISIKNNAFWDNAVLNVITHKNMFEIIQRSQTVFPCGKNKVSSNLYFYYLKKKD